MPMCSTKAPGSGTAGFTAKKYVRASTIARRYCVRNSVGVRLLTPTYALCIPV
jgi:hypothetical protein